MNRAPLRDKIVAANLIETYIQHAGTVGAPQSVVVSTVCKQTGVAKSSVYGIIADAIKRGDIINASGTKTNRILVHRNPIMPHPADAKPAPELEAFLEPASAKPERVRPELALQVKSDGSQVSFVLRGLKLTIEVVE